MGQAARNLMQELAEIEAEIAISESSSEISKLNSKALELKRELGLPLDN